MPAPIKGLVYTTSQHADTARTLATQLSLKLYGPRTASGAPGFSFAGEFDPGIYLIWDEGGLALQQLAEGPLPRPVRAMLSGPEIEARVSQGKRELLARAIGLQGHGTPTLTVLDATAGLGRDAAVMAALGAQIIMVERSPVLHALLADALQRCQAPHSQRLTLAACHDSRQWVASNDPAVDVVYLDPMFPDRNKTALARRELQMLRELLGADEDVDLLLPFALATARQRVVVKRHPQANPMKGRPPTFQLSSSRVRYDVYQQ